MGSPHGVKPKIGVEFVSLDGSPGQRSLMGDFQTLRARIFQRLQTIAPDCEDVVMAGVNAYNVGDYEAALAHFSEAISGRPVLLDELAPHVRSCKRALLAVPSKADILYRDARSAWLRLPRLLRWLRRDPGHKLRCKYCGHYTLFIHPESGVAYFGMNNCAVCGRGYPVPDFAWDGIDGLAYIYYRNSVTEDAFYAEFEADYDVHPNRTHFMKSKAETGAETVVCVDAASDAGQSERSDRQPTLGAGRLHQQAEKTNERLQRWQERAYKK